MRRQLRDGEGSVVFSEKALCCIEVFGSADLGVGNGALHGVWFCHFLLGPWTIFLTPTPGLSFHFCKSKNQKLNKQLCLFSTHVPCLGNGQRGLVRWRGMCRAARGDVAAAAPDWGPLAPT